MQDCIFQGIIALLHKSGECFDIVGETISCHLKIAKKTKAPIIIRTLPYDNKTGKWNENYEYVKYMCLPENA